jgi:hypothetical protein
MTEKGVKENFLSLTFLSDRIANLKAQLDALEFLIRSHTAPSEDLRLQLINDVLERPDTENLHSRYILLYMNFNRELLPGAMVQVQQSLSEALTFLQTSQATVREQRRDERARRIRSGIKPMATISQFYQFIV